jgi:hypothetical protein
MDDRLVIASVLGFGLVLILGLLALRYFKRRQAFKLRQSGRGKAAVRVPAE